MEWGEEKENVKKVAFVNQHHPFKERLYRFLAKWEYNGKRYEVIFGYGIEPDEEVWNDIKNTSYGFREEERRIIDSWFQ